MKWQPIETAPIQPFSEEKWFVSGDRLLLWVGTFATIGQYGYTQKGKGRWQANGRTISPSHWMRLPASPQDDERKWTMKPATPLPWYQAGDNELGEGVLGQGSGEYIAIMSDDRNPADYDYLIHAANAYPRLVEALRQMVGAMNQLDKGHHGDVVAAESLLRELGELK